MIVGSTSRNVNHQVEIADLLNQYACILKTKETNQKKVISPCRNMYT